MNEAYKEYMNEHPEELAGINHLKRHSRTVDRMRNARKKEMLREVHKWKEKFEWESLEQFLTEQQKT